jgi:hypothetical protein
MLITSDGHSSLVYTAAASLRLPPLALAGDRAMPFKETCPVEERIGLFRDYETGVFTDHD